jgi:hypothetical protein
MTNNQIKSGRIFYIFLLSIFVLASSLTVFGQKTQSGNWTAKISKKNSEKIHISFYRENTDEDRKDRDENHVSGSGFTMDELRGLSLGQINGSKSPVSFSLVRDAGTIQMIGSFENGNGSGTWTFTPDASFISSMESYGFNNISDKKLFASAILNVKTQTVSELINAGLKNLDYEDIFKATIFKVDANYISEMNTAGFTNLDMEDLVKARIFKIDANYAREILGMGFGNQSMEQLVKFRIFKVTPEFLNDMKSAGFANLTAEEVVQMRIFKIDAAFIQNARNKGYSNPSVGELVELKIHGKVN